VLINQQIQLKCTTQNKACNLLARSVDVKYSDEMALAGNRTITLALITAEYIGPDLISENLNGREHL
jgi:hypothetical protein